MKRRRPHDERALARAHAMGPAPKFDMHAASAAGNAAFDFRASAANVIRRENRGETVISCPDCGCEIDCEAPAHAPRCPR